MIWKFIWMAKLEPWQGKRQDPSIVYMSYWDQVNDDLLKTASPIYHADLPAAERSLYVTLQARQLIARKIQLVALIRLEMAHMIHLEWVSASWLSGHVLVPLSTYTKTTPKADQPSLKNFHGAVLSLQTAKDNPRSHMMQRHGEWGSSFDLTYLIYPIVRRIGFREVDPDEYGCQSSAGTRISWYSLIIEKLWIGRLMGWNGRRKREGRREDGLTARCTVRAHDMHIDII